MQEPQEMQVRSLGGEDPLKKGMATHFSILTWLNPWTEEPGGLHTPWSCKESDRTEATEHLGLLWVFVAALGLSLVAASVGYFLAVVS